LNGERAPQSPVNCGSVLFDVGSVFRIFPLLPGPDYDDNRSMSLWVNSLGKLGAPDCYARVLVQGLPISRCRQRNGQRLFPHSGIYGDGPDERLFECRWQWQPNAPAILPIVRDTTLQRGGGASPSDLRPCRHFRRTESCQSRDDNLDVICSALGMHRCRVANGDEATTASGVMSDA